MRSALYILLLCAAVAHCRPLGSCDTDNCGPRSPAYEVVGSHGATEIRKYDNATWAVSFGKSIFGVDVAAAVATKGIFAYFAGENNQHKKIPPSIPLITTLVHPHHPHPPHPPHPPKNGSHQREDPDMDKAVIQDDDKPDHPPHHHNGSHPHPHPPPPPGPPVVLAGAFVPLEGDLPEPDSRHVKLVKTNTSTVYSHSFGGFAISWLVKREIGHLKVDLKDLGLKPCKGKFFVATYDGPWKVIGRKNEVWWTELPRHNHTHHNHTGDWAATVLELQEETVLSGFEAFGERLFPEEAPPPPMMVEDLEDKMEDVVSAEDSGEWVTLRGQSSPESLQVS